MMKQNKITRKNHNFFKTLIPFTMIMLVHSQIPHAKEKEKDTLIRGFLTELCEINKIHLDVDSLVQRYKENSKLDLEKSGIKVLPGSIGNLVNLSELCIGQCKIRILPDSIGNLVNLETLFIYNSQLTTLPYTFGN